MSVGIIGAGPSGLAAAKSALEIGMQPAIFERSGDLGGIWHPKSGSTWDVMQTNLSKYSCMFSDYPWSIDEDLFPSRSKVYEYLKGYSEEFGLNKYINYGMNVTSLERVLNTNKWSIKTISNTGACYTKTFDCVIVASGFFTSQVADLDVPLNGNEKVEVIYSKDYRNPEAFKGKTVAVMGGSFSGSEIAADITKNAHKVIHVRDKRFWILPRLLNAHGQKTPLDLVFYKRKTPENPSPTPEENFRITHQWFSKLSPQSSVDSRLHIEEDQYSQPPYVVISDNYLSLVESGKIEIKEGRVSAINDDTIHIKSKDGDTSMKIHVLLVCSGFTSVFLF